MVELLGENRCDSELDCLEHILESFDQRVASVTPGSRLWKRFDFCGNGWKTLQNILRRLAKYHDATSRRISPGLNG